MTVTHIQIRMARAAIGIGVRELAREAGISPATLSRVENGGSANASTLEAIARACRDRGVRFSADRNGVYFVEPAA